METYILFNLLGIYMRQKIWLQLATYTITTCLNYYVNIIDSLLRCFSIFQTQATSSMKSDSIFQGLVYLNFSLVLKDLSTVGLHHAFNVAVKQVFIQAYKEYGNVLFQCRYFVRPKLLSPFASEETDVILCFKLQQPMPKITENISYCNGK